MICKNNRDGAWRAKTKFVWQLGRYKPSPPSTKELHGLCLINNRFTCLVESKLVKRKVSCILILPLRSEFSLPILWSNYCRKALSSGILFQFKVHCLPNFFIIRATGLSFSLQILSQLCSCLHLTSKGQTYNFISLFCLKHETSVQRSSHLHRDEIVEKYIKDINGCVTVAPYKIKLPRLL